MSSSDRQLENNISIKFYGLEKFIPSLLFYLRNNPPVGICNCNPGTTRSLDAAIKRGTIKTKHNQTLSNSYFRLISVQELISVSK